VSGRWWPETQDPGTCRRRRRRASRWRRGGRRGAGTGGLCPGLTPHRALQQGMSHGRGGRGVGLQLLEWEAAAKLPASEAGLIFVDDECRPRARNRAGKCGAGGSRLAPAKQCVSVRIAGPPGPRPGLPVGCMHRHHGEAGVAALGLSAAGGWVGGSGGSLVKPREPSTALGGREGRGARAGALLLEGAPSRRVVAAARVRIAPPSAPGCWREQGPVGMEGYEQGGLERGPPRALLQAQSSALARYYC
jgi:hypothetical protein